MNINGIYKIICTINNKFYIGSSNNCNKRFKRHLNELNKKNHTNIHLQRCYNLYGESCFKLEIIENIEDKNADLLLIEQIWLNKYYDGGKQCFNINNLATKPPKAIFGWKHSDETKAYLSEIHLGKKLSEEHKKNISKSTINKSKKPCSIEHKEKISKSNQGKKISIETKEKISKTMTGVNKSDLHKENMSKMFTQERKNNMSKRIKETQSGINNPMYGKKHSEETKEKIRQSHLKRKNV